jgi:serine protease
VPSGKSQLSVWDQNVCPDSVTYDWATITLTDNTGATSTVLPKTCSTSPWTNVTISVSAGRSYTLTMVNHDDNYASDPTHTLFDDATLN